MKPSAPPSTAAGAGCSANGVLRVLRG